MLIRLCLPWFRRIRGRKWPVAAATIQKAGVGSVPAGKGAAAPFSFFGYSFEVQGTRYAGLFGLSAGDAEAAQKLQEEMAGRVIQIRYKPSDPNISFIVDAYNPQFGGHTLSQNQDFLDHAPNVDLRFPAS